MFSYNCRRNLMLRKELMEMLIDSSHSKVKIGLSVTLRLTVLVEREKIENTE
jgi:hypothetical protein